MKVVSRRISLSITIKVLLFVALCIGAPGFVLFYHSLNVSRDLLRQALEEKGITIARSIAKSSQLQIMVGDYQSLKKLIDGYKKEHTMTFLHIYLPNGNLLTSTEASGAVEYSDLTLSGIETIQINYPTLPNGEEVMDIVFPITIQEMDSGSQSMGLEMEMSSEPMNTGKEMPVNPEISDKTAPPTDKVPSELKKIGIIRMQLSMQLMRNRITAITKQFLMSNLVVFLIVFTIVLIFINRIIKPFNDIISTLQEITYSNDLARKVKVPRQREMSIMAHSFNMLIETLAFQIEKTKEAVSQIGNSINSLLHASHQQEDASRDQVTSVTETIASMAELSQSSRLINQNSAKVANFADNTLKNAQLGVDSVKKVVYSISRIDESSKSMNVAINDLVSKLEEIQKILSIIDEFTEQTKLIAFNAAIEASSAKEVGRRFGVVAMEVRKLAGDIEKSSRTINKVVRELRETSGNTLTISNESQLEVKKGVDITAEVKNAITRIFDSVAETTSASKQISSYTSQQISANDEVVSAVKEILKLAERSMEDAQEINHVSQNLSELTGNLSEMVAKFRI